LPDLNAYYERRYRDERRRVDEIAAGLGGAQAPCAATASGSG